MLQDILDVPHRKQHTLQSESTVELLSDKYELNTSSAFFVTEDYGLFAFEGVVGEAY